MDKKDDKNTQEIRGALAILKGEATSDAFVSNDEIHWPDIKPDNLKTPSLISS